MTKYPKSIMGVPMDACYVCGCRNVEIHHIMFGVCQKKLSTKYGLVIPLCIEHHRGNTGAHFNRTLNMELKELAQKRFDEVYKGNTSFFEVFGKNYIYDEVEK